MTKVYTTDDVMMAGQKIFYKFDVLQSCVFDEIWKGDEVWETLKKLDRAENVDSDTGRRILNYPTGCIGGPTKQKIFRHNIYNNKFIIWRVQ